VGGQSQSIGVDVKTYQPPVRHGRFQHGQRMAARPDGGVDVRFAGVGPQHRQGLGREHGSVRHGLWRGGDGRQIG
jgi:hypothetical protein